MLCLMTKFNPIRTLHKNKTIAGMYLPTMCYIYLIQGLRRSSFMKICDLQMFSIGDKYNHRISSLLTQ